MAKPVKYEIVVPITVGKYRIKVYCFIWEKKYQMDKATKVNGAHAHTRLIRNKKDHIEIHFWLKRLGLEYVVHEFAHASIFIANLLDYAIQTPIDSRKYGDYRDYVDEEIFVRVLGKAVKTFYEKLHKAGISEIPDLVESKPL